MNMKKTAYIGLEMLKSAVLHAMLKEKQGGSYAVSAKDISLQIGIPPSKEKYGRRSYSLIRHVLLHLKEKKLVAHPADNTWQITEAGESFLDTDFI